MNYLTSVYVNSQQKIDAESEVFKNCNVIANKAKTFSPVGKGKGILILFLMISCLILAFMPKNSMAARHDFFSTGLFCKAECSEFVLFPATIGVGVGALAGVSVGIGLGVPVAIGMSTAMAVKGDKPGKVLLAASSGMRLNTFIAAVFGIQAVSNVMAFPFWITEKVVYDAPLKVVNLVRSNF